MKLASSLAAACLLAASTPLFAQAPKDDAKAARQQLREKVAKACEGKQGDERRACVRKEICAQSKDPKACEQRAAKGREAHAKARKACEGKPDGERRDCMRKALCASSKDPAKCEAQAKEWLAQRDKAREACKGKAGDGLRSCLREQMNRK
jgi:hypothetical protein